MTAPEQWTAMAAAAFLAAPSEDSDKYSRGVVGVRTGSPRYPGAAVLGVEAAWRAGAGMVRYVGHPEVASAVLARRPETVVGVGRVQAWVVGSGTDPAERSAEETEALVELLHAEVPVVVDAGALDLLREHGTEHAIATPHANELARMRVTAADPTGDDDERARAVVEAADALGCVVVLKGHRTLVAAPDGSARAVEPGTPWLATAGTGDVLAGTIGAVVAGAGAGAASGEETSIEALISLAATAVWIHGRAGLIAADAESGPGHPITALDVAEALPHAVGHVLRLG